MISRKRRKRVESHAILYCRAQSKTKAKRPSISETSELRTTVARTEPSATVTTRSKAFSLESVRLPETRRKATSRCRQGFW